MSRKLNAEEQKVVSTMIERGKLADTWNPDEMKVSYHTRFPFTAAIVSQGKDTLIGFSKYNYNDKKLGLRYKPEVGERVAFAKALK